MEDLIRHKFELFRAHVLETYLSEYEKVEFLLHINEDVNITIYAYGEPFHLIVNKDDFLADGFVFIANLPKYEKDTIWYSALVIYRETVFSVRKNLHDSFEKRKNLLQVYLSSIGGKMPDMSDSKNWNLFMKEYDRVTAMYPILNSSKYNELMNRGYTAARLRI